MRANTASKRRGERLLAGAGVRIGGKRPWDIHVHNPRMFSRVIAEGSLGLGESYMDGWWECERLDEFLLKDRYDARFFRMWRYYLLSCAGAFRARANQVWQIVLSPHGVPGGYRIERESSVFQHPRTDAPGPRRRTTPRRSDMAASP